MICWQCSEEIALVYESGDFSVKLYHCGGCDRWYEMKKDKVKINGASPIKFVELDSASAAVQLLDFESKPNRRRKSVIY